MTVSEHDISNRLTLEGPSGNGGSSRDVCAVKGQGLLLYQPHQGKLRQKQMKGKAKLQVRDQHGNNIPTITNLPLFPSAAGLLGR